MSVVIAKSAIVKRWRDNGSIFEVRSKVAVETLIEVVGASLERHEAAHPDELVELGVWSTPRGAAFMAEDLETQESLLAVIDEVAAGLEAAGIDARIGPSKGDLYRWPDPWHNDGFSAAMTIVGQPYWDAPGDPGGRRPLQRMWDVDVSARDQMVEQAVRWCEVDGGDLWHTVGITPFKIPRDQAVSLMIRSLNTGEKCEIVAERDAGLVRRVEFGYNGFVIYEVGGAQCPPWQTCVEDLTSVLVDAHPFIEWGHVHRRSPGAKGIGTGSPSVVHNALWEPYEDRVPVLGYRQDPRHFPHLLLDVYGVQVLGPGHDVTVIGEGWDVRELGDGRTLVSATDQAEWFAAVPSLGTLLGARDSFGPLVDPLWSPQHD